MQTEIVSWAVHLLLVPSQHHLCIQNDVLPLRLDKGVGICRVLVPSPHSCPVLFAPSDSFLTAATLMTLSVPGTFSIDKCKEHSLSFHIL